MKQKQVVIGSNLSVNNSNMKFCSWVQNFWYTSLCSPIFTNNEQLNSEHLECTTVINYHILLSQCRTVIIHKILEAEVLLVTANLTQGRREVEAGFASKQPSSSWGENLATPPHWNSKAQFNRWVGLSLNWDLPGLEHPSACAIGSGRVQFWLKSNIANSEPTNYQECKGTTGLVTDHTFSISIFVCQTRMGIQIKKWFCKENSFISAQMW